MRVKLLAYIPSKDLINEVGEIPDVELLSHLAYVFAVEGISRVCSHQLVRHRVASYSQQSQRYVEVERLKEYVVIPKTIEGRGREIFDALIEEASKAYRQLIKLGVPREDARFVLPNATETHLMVTMDGRSLLHFFGLRCCLRAQWEIREVADEMLREVRRVEPQLFRGAGPYCYQLGYCPEGRFTCGRMEEVKMRYSSLGYGADGVE